MTYDYDSRCIEGQFIYVCENWDAVYKEWRVASLALFKNKSQFDKKQKRMNDPSKTSFVRSILRVAFVNNQRYILWYDIHGGKCKRGPNSYLQQMKIYKPNLYDVINGKIEMHLAFY